MELPKAAQLALPENSALTLSSAMLSLQSYVLAQTDRGPALIRTIIGMMLLSAPS